MSDKKGKKKKKEKKWVRKPETYIEYENMKFVIFDSPRDENINEYLEVLESHKVTHIVRLCGNTYNIETFTNNGFQTFDLKYDDGHIPPKDLIKTWLGICKSSFSNKKENNVIGIHCIAGLGRAPVLVAIALIERGMEPIDAITLIRNKRSGSINAPQLSYLRKYKRSNGCNIL